MMKKLWGGRFEKAPKHSVDEFTASIHFDQFLWEADIQGSLAHVQALLKANLLNTTEATTLTNGLNKLAEKIHAGSVKFNLSDEDIHMNIERLLFAEVGEVAGKLHTGRSRNDQVALDMHLYLRQQLITTVKNIVALQQVLLHQAEQHLDVIMPGYTHLQHAQPIRLGHHWLAYFFMLQRDAERLMNSWGHVNQLPLGAGALAGSGFDLDRNFVAQQLGFNGVYNNSMDAVSDRDFVIEFLSHAALIMMHLSRLSEEIILWSSQEFAFIELDDEYCTGSSMMPQKKNPDVAELVRGKTGRVYGTLMGLLTTMKGLPLAYNKDMQEDKEGLVDVIKTVNTSLQIYAGMLTSIKVNQEKMLNAVKNNFSCATALADYLVKQGMPFREAHRVIGSIVQYCIEYKLKLTQLSLSKLHEFSPLFTEEAYTVLQPHIAVETCQVVGGTAKKSVLQQMTFAAECISKSEQWCDARCGS